MPLVGEIVASRRRPSSAVGGGIADDVGPERRAGEAADDADAELLGGLHRGQHLLGGPLAARRRARRRPRRNRAGACDARSSMRIADRLADAVIAEHRARAGRAGRAGRAFAGSSRPRSGRAAPRSGRPSSTVPALVAPLAGLLRQLLQRQVGPLPAEQDAPAVPFVLLTSSTCGLAVVGRRGCPPRNCGRGAGILACHV